MTDAGTDFKQIEKLNKIMKASSEHFEFKIQQQEKQIVDLTQQNRALTEDLQAQQSRFSEKNNRNVCDKARIQPTTFPPPTPAPHRSMHNKCL